MLKPSSFEKHLNKHGQATVRSLRLLENRAWQVAAVLRVYSFLSHTGLARSWKVDRSPMEKPPLIFPVIDLLKSYFQIQDRAIYSKIREKVTGKLLTLDEALENTLPAFLALLDAFR